MKLFTLEHFRQIENPDPRVPYRPEIPMHEYNARALGAMFGLLGPGMQVPYHYHRRRESILIVISGEAIEIVEGEETPITAGDILFIPAGEKHTVINRSSREFRFLEFFTCPPLKADFFAADEPNAGEEA